MEDTPGDPNLPNEAAIAAEEIKRKRREDIPALLEGLAMSYEADIRFNWPDTANDPFKGDDRKVIPREWASVSALRARAALFREAAALIRGPQPPVAMLPKGSMIGRVSMPGEPMQQTPRSELSRGGVPIDDNFWANK